MSWSEKSKNCKGQKIKTQNKWPNLERQYNNFSFSVTLSTKKMISYNRKIKITKPSLKNLKITSSKKEKPRTYSNANKALFASSHND